MASRTWWRRTRIGVLAVVGAVIGLGVAGTPVALMAAYIVSFSSLLQIIGAACGTECPVPCQNPSHGV
jgi:predicted PurR-regulated permease PerM